MAEINPIAQDQDEELLVPLPRSLDWTLKVTPLQTDNPVSLMLLHETVPTTNSKQLEAAIMASTEWNSCDIPIVVKEDLFKASLNEVVTRDNRAAGQIVWCVRKHNTQALQLVQPLAPVARNTANTNT
jgi:hypothetical protein